MEFCIEVLTDEIRALKLTVSTFIIELFFHLRVLISLPRYCYKIRNQHQLLRIKFQNSIHYYLKKTTIFQIIIKNLMKCNILSTFAFKNYRKFVDHNLEKLCPQSLALTITFLGLERVCPRKFGPWPWIFFLSLASNVVSSTPLLLITKLFLVILLTKTKKRKCLLSANFILQSNYLHLYKQ